MSRRKNDNFIMCIRFLELTPTLCPIHNTYKIYYDKIKSELNITHTQHKNIYMVSNEAVCGMNISFMHNDEEKKVLDYNDDMMILYFLYKLLIKKLSSSYSLTRLNFITNNNREVSFRYYCLKRYICEMHEYYEFINNFLLNCGSSNILNNEKKLLPKIVHAEKK